MSPLQLIIGNKNYSSWSLRPWLAMKRAKIEFEEILIPLYRPDTDERLKKLSPSGKVPVLKDGETLIWESLAIGEYLAEKFPEKHLWPKDPSTRALARAVASEMHAGFADLRSECPFNARRDPKPISLSAGAQKDVRRVQQIWKNLRDSFGGRGPFLFGEFSYADAMFAPVAFRFHHYAVPVSPEAKAYMETLFTLPEVKDWVEAGRHEVWVIPASEK